MKKMDMVKHIQAKEAKFFLFIKQAELVFGSNSEPHKRARANWNSIMELMGELSIESDYNLPAHIEAYKIMSTILKNEDIAI